MNFFEQQAQSRSHSKRLILLFALAVAAIVFAVDTVVLIAVDRFGSHGMRTLSPTLLWLSHPGVAWWATLGVLALIGIGTLYKTSSLRAGGSAVAAEFGATLVSADNSNFAYRRLRNVVEEIAIASGVPVPEIYVLENEPGINAFAAGFTPADAAITVTRGALERLTRDELQGVIGHEFSHILNGDMRLNIRLMGTLFGILLIALAGQKVLQNMRGDSKDSWPILLAALALMLIGYVGLFFGRLIKAGVSREREFLADASAVQFTRQATGIAGALKKIGVLEGGSKLSVSKAEEVSHMLFGDGVGLSAMFATHPPLDERIRRIEPRYDPRELDDIARRWGTAAPVGGARDDGYEHGAEVSLAGFAPAGAGVPRSAVRAQQQPLAAPRTTSSSNVVRQRVGTPTDSDMRTAQQIGSAMPETLRVAAYMQDRAPGLVLALALDADPALRANQLDQIASAYNPEQRAFAEGFYPELAALDPMLRLPLAALAFPALRRQPRQQLLRFVAALDRVIRADQRVDLREFCLATLVTHLVKEAMDPSRANVMGKRKLIECADAAAALLAIVAQQGNDSDAAARAAYLDGIGRMFSQAAPAYAPPADWQGELERALATLDQLEPTSKALLIEGLTASVDHDGRMTLAESELLRTICSCLHCPLPPMLAQQLAA
jgi:Zn-dependent protease with chaperone function